MDSVNGNDDSATDAVPVKFAKASDISTEAFLAAARAVGTGIVHLHEVAWRLSNFEQPVTLTPAPDVSEYALKQKANQLVFRGVIKEPKPGSYLIPPAAQR